MNTQPVPEALPVLVALPAEIDVTNALDMYDQITAAALKPDATIIIADMTATTFCDGMGLRILLLAHEFAARNGTGLRLLKPGRNVRRVMELEGADQVLTICESLEKALLP